MLQGQGLQHCPLQGICGTRVLTPRRLSPTHLFTFVLTAFLRVCPPLRLRAGLRVPPPRHPQTGDYYACARMVGGLWDGDPCWRGIAPAAGLRVQHATLPRLLPLSPCQILTLP